MTDVAPRRMSALQKLRGARDILDVAINHVERAHVGDAFKRRGVREQGASAIGHAGMLVAEAGALFAVEVLREGVVTNEPAQPGCGVHVEDGTPCGTDRGKSIALCETCFDVALDRAGWKGPR